MDELGIYSDRTNKTCTYEKQQYSPEAVPEEYTRSMGNKFNIK